MFKNPFQVAVSFAVIALIIKVTVFSLNKQHGDMERYIVYIYMLITLLSVFFGIRSNKVMYDKPTNFAQDFKSGARTSSFLAILIAIITYTYYAKIDPTFFEIKKSEIINQLPIKIKHELDKKELSVEKIKQYAVAEINNANALLNPQFQAMWTLLLLVFLGLTYSATFALLMKKFSGFKQ